MAFNFKMPDSCINCDNCGHYTNGPYARNPHYCCELIWRLFGEDYKVDPDIIDENCPYKNETFMKALTEISHRL